MFERFTERARQVVVLAQDEARELGHGYIGTEHELLGLLREGDGIAARVLGDLGVALDDVRSRVRAVVGEGPGQTTGQIPFTPRAKTALDLANSEASALGHPWVGTEHVLLGLVGLREGVACDILEAIGASPARVRDSVIAALGGQSRE